MYIYKSIYKHYSKRDYELYRVKLICVSFWLVYVPRLKSKIKVDLFIEQVKFLSNMFSNIFIEQLISYTAILQLCKSATKPTRGSFW